MPRDTWAKANNRAKYGPAIQTKTKHHHKLKKGGNSTQQKKLATRFSECSKLTFGRHANTQIKDIPISYLEWMAATIIPKNRYMRGLVCFIKQYLAKMHGGLSVSRNS